MSAVDGPDVVLLVGGGPGDPELLTLRGEAALRTATTVVADRDVAGLAAAVGASAEVVVADGVDAVLAAVRAATRPVVRLYVGDPWLHPQHDAEVAALHAAGIATVAVPGVSVELGHATAAGQPVHHRPVSVVVTLADGRIREAARG